ncbi:hypothetical protein BD626DRAFT_409643 [Schizophyllum amplum]|uniref:MARVEL domain-containing protein n=1 Tax=Schizophyllum amplum TaxID=97359 RepID=A0A550C2N0_9AGAR|nr:hypothetical protein BD626DRAFT_409643 [Auriculariopsis ampla]
MAVSTVSIPLSLPLFLSMFLTWAFGIISFGMCISSYRGLNGTLKKDGADVGEVFSTDGVITAITGCIFAISWMVLFLMYTSPSLVMKSLKALSGVYWFFVIWLFATLIPYTQYIRKDSPTYADGSGTWPEAYKSFDYLVWISVFGWICWFFTLVTACLLPVAASKAQSYYTRRAYEEKAVPQA